MNWKEYKVSLVAVSHKSRQYNINKISLSWFVDKIYILDDGIKTLACGHKNISDSINDGVSDGISGVSDVNIF